MLLNLYKTVVCSILEYKNAIWGPHFALDQTVPWKNPGKSHYKLIPNFPLYDIYLTLTDCCPRSSQPEDGEGIYWRLFISLLELTHLFLLLGIICFPPPEVIDIHYNTIHHNAIELQYNPVHYNATELQYNPVHYNAIELQCNPIHYNAIELQYNPVHYNAIELRTIQSYTL